MSGKGPLWLLALAWSGCAAVLGVGLGSASEVGFGPTPSSRGITSASTEGDVDTAVIPRGATRELLACIYATASDADVVAKIRELEGRAA